MKWDALVPNKKLKQHDNRISGELLCSMYKKVRKTSRWKIMFSDVQQNQKVEVCQSSRKCTYGQFGYCKKHSNRLSLN